jgi:hypothetical protein
LLVAFQFCYDVRGRERVLSWRRPQGFGHNRIDSSDAAWPYPMSPIFSVTARFPHRWVRKRLGERAAILAAATRRFILDKMREYGRAQARGTPQAPPAGRR